MSNGASRRRRSASSRFTDDGRLRSPRARANRRASPSNLSNRLLPLRTARPTAERRVRRLWRATLTLAACRPAPAKAADDSNEPPAPMPTFDEKKSPRNRQTFPSFERSLRRPLVVTQGRDCTPAGTAVKAPYMSVIRKVSEPCADVKKFAANKRTPSHFREKKIFRRATGRAWKTCRLVRHAAASRRGEVRQTPENKCVGVDLTFLSHYANLRTKAERVSQTRKPARR